MNRLKSQLHFLHVLKDAASDDLIKAIVEYALNTLNGNHELPKDEKRRMQRYKKWLRALVNPNISFKSKCKLLIKKGRSIVPLFTSILSGVIGALINKKWLCNV